MSMIGEIRPCRSCGHGVLFAQTAGGKLMPLEYAGAEIPADMGRNVAFYRASSGRTTARVLKAGETKEDHETLTVAHFAVCPAADLHRRARRGEIPNVIPLRKKATR